MNRAHRLTAVKVVGDRLMMQVDGKSREFRLSEISSALAKASAEEKTTMEVSPSGYGIHWPLLDEDLSIDGLLGVRHKPHVAKGRTPPTHASHRGS